MAKTCGLQEGSRREIRQQYEANSFIKMIKMAKNGTEHINKCFIDLECVIVSQQPHHLKSYLPWTYCQLNEVFQT